MYLGEINFSLHHQCVNCRIRSLEAELLSKKEVEHEEAVHLEKAMEQVEDNLKRSTVSRRLKICTPNCKLQFLIDIDYIVSLGNDDSMLFVFRRSEQLMPKALSHH